ncbi:MAG TPA: YoaK family protein [Reyranella sp.]|nr:YoaK family protein [Reyranella sp.]
MANDKSVLQALLLTVVAGIADAIGYITMGGVFTANMTGNTVLAGIAAAEGFHELAIQRLAPLLTFFAGALLARLLLRLFDRPMAPLLLEAAILAGVGLLPLGREPTVMIVALAMGLQASAITHFGGTAVSTVVVTSTLARMADATLDRLWPATPQRPLPSIGMPRLLALTWLGYLAGAVAGTMLLHLTAWPLMVPAVLLLAVITLL